MRKFLPLLFAFVLSTALAADPWSESYRLESAGKYLDAAAQIEPLAKTGEFAQLRHAWLLYRAGRLDESVAAYRRAQQMNPNSLDAMLGLSLPLMAQWKWKEAADVTRTLLRYAPWHYAGSVRLLVILEAQKQWRPMADEAQRLVERYPADATAWVYLARAEAASGNTDNARDAYRHVLQIVPDHAEASGFLKR
ncbi:MAG: tetratricopeptide repeat protein [Rhodocyclaceae bacterium]|nr:tetratricopeptide repeat protein [Rhodocyclaceae bacterium]